MKQKNPFPICGYSGPEYFCDRVVETQKMVEALENGRNMTLIAPRRLGKTGLIQHVLGRISARGEAQCVYLDIFAVKTLSEFVQTFARAVFTTLETRLEKAAKAASQFLSSCRPALSIDVLTGTPTFSVAVQNAAAETTLQEVFNYLKTKDTPIIIAIDEFQQVAEFPEKGAEALLRSYIQFLPQVRFIFSGSKLHMMTEMFMSANRPFYKSTQSLSLKPIAEDVYFAFAADHFSRVHRKLSKKAFHFAYELSDGITWEIQSILNRLWVRGGNIDDEESIREVVSDILAENADEYGMLFASLSLNESKLLKAVAKLRCVKAPTGAAFLTLTGLSPSSVRLSLQSLIARQILYPGESGVLVYDRFLGLWLQERS